MVRRRAAGASEVRHKAANIAGLSPPNDERLQKCPGWSGRAEIRVKQADKRDSVTALAGYDGHSSGTRVAARLQPPTRRLGGPRRRLPTWSFSAYRLAVSPPTR